MKINEKKIPVKNYVIVFIMFVVCIAIIFGVRSWYRNYKQYQLTIPVISGKVSEINISEFDAFLTAHDDFYLYVGTADNYNCRKLEKDLVDLLQRKNILNETVYLNMSNKSTNKNTLIEKLSSIDYKDKKINYPAFLIIKDGKIINYITKKIGIVKISDVEKILDEYEVGIK